ncbi:MAG: D-alanyl-D-alanine carboxypeptidase [Methylocystaceae bacterium]|jgi:D-alanyl-D-alanine carboxypeptidase|nr:D-alanyl-D-alanine carboxypeptidase [Methylocystaceae bacterium]NBV94072.1 D-alanyl-D-alanine carboxypeptidase [Methylocystaceae bacterium]
MQISGEKTKTAHQRLRRALFVVSLSAACLSSSLPAHARRHHSSTQFSHAHARLGHSNADNDAVGRYHGFAAIVIDGNNGHTLYARNEDELRHPASVTKVMTLYLLFEQLEKGRLRLDTPLMISSHAAAQAPSKLGLAPGQTITVENAIKALVTKSANDIACAVAENIGGSEHAFAQIMTNKAHSLGMAQTHYENASGLPDPDQVTTAKDLSILGRAIQERFPKYYKYFSTHVFAYNGALHRNHNHLLGRVEGMDGIKTGYTRASGFNLLTSVRRGHHHIVAVVMGGVSAGSRDNIMADLIEKHIGEGSSVRSAAAITEDNNTTQTYGENGDQAGFPAKPTRVSQALVENSLGKETPQRVGGRLVSTSDIDAEPVGTAHAQAEPVASPLQDKVLTHAQIIRPAFVSGVQKTKMVMPDLDKKRRIASLNPSSALVQDGSTTTRVAKSVSVSGNSTTPSTLRPAGNQSHGEVETSRPLRSGWMIQIAAAESNEKANVLLNKAKSELQGLSPQVKAFTEKVQKGNETLYRARFAGLEQQSAEAACKILKRSGLGCFVTKN